MDPIQLTIVAVSFILTILVVALGVQVWFILKEMRTSIMKMNKMLDDAGKVSGTVSDGVQSMSGFVTGIKTGLNVITSFTNKKKDE
jgi:hypothetical protein